MNGKNLLPLDGELHYWPSFFSEEESRQFFETILNETPWKQEPIKVFGKEVLQPRLTASYGERSYTYSGITMSSAPWTEALLQIKTRIEDASGEKFNTALLNYYRDGNDSMGWHRDAEKELGENPAIASVSFGEKRIFKMKHRNDLAEQLSLEVQGGSFLLMRGTSQHNWLHSVPKTAKEKAPRLNITFRQVF